MTSIIKAAEQHAELLSMIAKTTFIESHGHSASEEDIDNYIKEKYSVDILKKELKDPENSYYILYHNNVVAGYSKILLNTPYENSPVRNITKLERLYLLEDFYNEGLGSKLFNFIIGFAKQHQQQGIWLFTWKENQRAIDFYTKKGFIIIGSHDFKISETHSNANHQMLVSFK